MGRRHVFQSVQGFFRFGLLHHSQDGVEDHDQKNQQRLKELHGIVTETGHHKAHRRSRQQNHNHHVLELLQEPPQIGFLFLFCQLVGAVLLQARLGLLLRESGVHGDGKLLQKGLPRNVIRGHEDPSFLVGI